MTAGKDRLFNSTTMINTNTLIELQLMKRKSEYEQLLEKYVHRTTLRDHKLFIMCPVRNHATLLFHIFKMLNIDWISRSACDPITTSWDKHTTDTCYMIRRCPINGNYMVSYSSSSFLESALLAQNQFPDHSNRYTAIMAFAFIDHPETL